MATEVKVPEYRLKGQNPADVRRLWESKEISDDEAADYIALEDLRVSGFYGMETTSARHLTARGHLSEAQAQDYIDNAKSPTWFSIGDAVKRGIPHGLNEAARGIGRFIDEALSAPAAAVNVVTGLGDPEKGIRLPKINVFQPADVAPDPKTLTGDITSEITEFATPFIPAHKTVKIMQLGEKVIATRPFQALLSKFPKLQPLAAEAVTGAIAGGPSDYLNNPYEGRLSDVAREAGVLPDYLEFMTTNPNNPEAIERLKNVVEGMGLGIAVDSLLFLAKGVKAKLWAKNGGDAARVAEEVRVLHPDVEPRTLDEPTPQDFRGPSADTGEAARENFDAAAPSPDTRPGWDRPQTPEEIAAMGKMGEKEFTQAKAAGAPVKLPIGLEKASPKYKTAEVEFTSGIDKAIYIVSGKGQSKSHEAYKKWLRNSVGMTDEQIAEVGQRMRDYLEEQPDGDFHTIPEHYAPPAPKKEPVVVVKKKTSAPKLAPEDINKAEPWQLSQEQYAQRGDSVKLPRGRDLLENPKLLDVESMTKADAQDIARVLNINPNQAKRDIASQVRATLALKDALDEFGTEIFEKMPAAERREWYKNIMQAEMPKGKASTAERLHADLTAKLAELTKAAERQLGNSKHAALVRRAAEDGRDIPGYVLESYHESDWVREYAAKRGLNLEPKAEPAVTPAVEAQALKATPVQEPKLSVETGQAASVDTGKISTEAPGKPASTARITQAINVFKAETDGTIRAIDEHLIDDSNFLQRIEKGSNHGTVGLLNSVYRESFELIEAARKRGSGEFTTIQAKSDAVWKRLADLSGKSKEKTIETFMGAARGMYADMQSKAAQAHFLNEFLTTYTKQVDELIDTAMRTQDRVKELQAITHIKQLQELNAIIFGVRAEGSRMLNINKMTNMTHKFDFGSLPTEALDEISAAKSKEIKEALAAYKHAADPTTKMRIARSIGQNKFLRGVLEYVQANLLWNPATHALNLIANTGNAAFKMGVRALAVGAQGVAKGDMRYLHQMGAIMSGAFEGFVSAVVSEDMIRSVWKTGSWSKAARGIKQPGNMWKSLWKGESIIDTIVREGSDASDSVLRQAAGDSMWMKPLAVAITSPFNALAAGDELFKNIAYFSRVKDLCSQAAIDANVPRKEMSKYVSNLQVNLPVDLHYKAVDYMRDVTFQGKLGEFGQKIEGALSTEIGTMFRIGFMPFFKTPANILTQAFGMTPLGALQKQFRKDIMKAGSIEQKEAITKLLAGSALMFGAYQMFEAGLITGRKPREASQAWDNAGIQEYSIQSGGKSVAYDRTDPFGMVIGMVADTCLLFKYMDAYQQDQIDGQQVFSAAMLTLTEPTLNKTWMTSMRDAVQLATGDTRMNAGRMMAKQSEKFLPAVSAAKFIKDQIDPVVREYNTLLDGFYAYFDRDDLPTKRHGVYGTPVLRTEKEYGVFKTREHSDDPVMQEMLSINMNVKPMSNRIVKGKIEQKLTPAEMQQVNDILSEKLPLKEVLTETIGDPKYQQIQDADTRADILSSIVGGFRSTAKDIFLSQSGENVAKLRADAIAKAEAIKGYRVAPDPIARMFNWNQMGQMGSSQPE